MSKHDVSHLPHGSGDKRVEEIDWYERSRRVKTSIVIVAYTVDGWSYRFQQLTRSDPATFVHKQAPDGCRYKPDDGPGRKKTIVPNSVVESLEKADWDVIARTIEKRQEA